MKKRVVSFILILVMLMTAMPWPSFADEPQTEPAAPAVETVVSGDEEPAEESQPQPELPAVEEKKEFEIKESQPELSKAEEKDKVELPPVEKEEEKEEEAVKLTLVFTNAFGWAVKKEVEQGKAITYLPTAPEYEGFRFVRWYREVTKLADDGVTVKTEYETVYGTTVADAEFTVFAEYEKIEVDEPTGDEPTGDEPTGDEPTGDEPTGDEPTGDEPTGDEPTGDEPTGDEPTGDEPTGDEPTGDEPTGDEPTGDEPTGDEPTGDEPTGDEPTGDEPTGDEPVEITYEPDDIVVDYTDAATGVAITVPFKALPEGVKPEDVTITVSTLGAAALAELNAMLGEGNELLVAYDIVFRANGIEFEPADMVNVMFPLPTTDSEDELKVYHMSDDNVIDEVTSATFTDGVCEFSADAFSTYFIVTQPRANEGTTDNWPEPLVARWNETYVDPLDPNGQEYGTLSDAREPVVLSISGPAKVDGIGYPEFRAGETVQYSVTYGFNKTANYSGGEYDAASALFDYYEHVTMTVTIPAGLKPTNWGTGNTVYSVTPDDAEFDFSVPHTYVLNTASGSSVDATHDTSFDFTFQLYIGNNGQAGAVNTYGTDEDEDKLQLTLTTDFTLYDKRNNVALTDYHDSKEATVTGDGFVTASPDDWGVTKAESAAAARNDTDKTVTFTWNLSVGLTGSNGLLTQPDDYSRYGRDLTTAVTLKETLSTLLDEVAEAAGSRTLLSAKISRVPANGGQGPEVTLYDNTDPSTSLLETEIPIWPEASANANLLMNHEQRVDIDGDSQPDLDTPVYTTYKVVVVYQYKDSEIANFWENVHTLKGVNTVDITATMASKPEPITNTASAPSQKDLPKKVAGSFQISKMLWKYGAAGAIAYDNSFGPITYAISSTDNSEIFVYTRSGSGNNITWTRVGSTGATSVTVAAGTEYYIVSGVEYQVSEDFASTDMVQDSVTIAMGSAAPEVGDTFTAANNTKASVTFTNKETKGAIIVEKVDQFNAALKDAEFELTGPNGYSKTDFTDRYGKITFDNLAYGVYTLREKNPPLGYTGDSHVETITVNEYYQTTTYHFVNHETRGTIVLNKYVGVNQATVSTSSFTKVTDGFMSASDSTQPAATFVLQRTTTPNDPNSWETAVKLDGTAVPTQLGGDGTLTVYVAAKNPSGQFYTYRFKETITDTATYYPVYPLNDDANSQYSEPFTFTQEGQTATFNMFNRKYVSIKVYKNFYNYTTSGDRTLLDTKTIPVNLYRCTGTPSSPSDLEHVGTEQTARSSGTTASWSTLPLFDANNNAYTYYIKETEETGYTFASADTDGTKVEIGTGNWYAKINPSTSTNYTTRLYNYRQAIPVHVIKRNTNQSSSSGTDYYIDQCKVTIYTDPSCSEDKIAVDAQTGAQLKDVLIAKNGTGAAFFLEEGKKYYYKETVCNVLFEFDHLTTDDSTFTNASAGKTIGVIDLTNKHQPGTGTGDTGTYNATTKYKRYDIYNKPIPRINISKKEKYPTNNADLNKKGAKFKVYTRVNVGTEANPSYVYAPYPSAEDQYELTADGATDALAFPVGTYYFSESAVPSGYLDPNLSEEVMNDYAALDTSNTYVRGVVQGTNPPQTLTFIEKQVEFKSSGYWSANAFTFYNIKNQGSVTVQKTLFGANLAKAGFMVEFYNGTTKVGSKTTGTDGKATASTTSTGVTGQTMPVFDANGNRIVYTVKEGAPSTWTSPLADEYYKLSDGQTFVLHLGKTATTDNATPAKTLTVDNATYLKISTAKIRTNGWLGGEFTMDGATIALYRRVAAEEGQSANAWELVPNSSQVTANGGQVLFSKLERTDANGVAYEFALVETDSGSSVYLPYQENPKNAANSPWKLSTPPATIPDAQMKEYNAQILSASMITNNTSVYALNTLNNNGPLVNRSHWVQFHVTKYLDDQSLEDNKAENNSTLYDANGHAYNISNGDRQNPLSDCVFSLYRTVLPEGATEVTFNRETWTYMQTYTSGSLVIVGTDQRLPGQFLTIVDEGLTGPDGNVTSGVNENYVYVLVEDNVGPNSCIINPHFKYTAWYCGQHAQVTVTADGKAVENVYTYNLDQINDGEVLDSWEEGNGSSNILLAALRMTKWYDTYNADGELNRTYDPLEGTHFQLKLAGTSTVLAELYPYLTQGTDSDGITYRYAFAQSGTFELENYEDDAEDSPQLVMYEEEGSPSGDPITLSPSQLIHLDIPGHPGYNAYGVPVDLVEVSAPEGYGFMPVTYQTYLIFIDETPESQTEDKWTFYNDLYFVKTGGLDTTTTLANTQTSRLWYVRNADHIEEAFGNVATSPTPGLLRIWDFPTNNTTVIVHKVGYKPTEQTKGKDSEYIALGNFGAEPMNGVTMELEKNTKDDGTGDWKPWDADANNYLLTGTYSFTTEADTGSYTFYLPQGYYRIKETNLGSWAASHENAYPGGKTATSLYRYFFVGGAPMNVYMANPEKLDLSIKKTKLDGTTPVPGLQFSLIEKGKTSGTNKTTGDDGKVSFDNIASGTYYLTETALESGMSIQYFKELFAAQNPLYAGTANGTNLVDSAKGYFIGYEYALTPLSNTVGEKNKDVVITTISDLGYQTLELTVANPELVSVSLAKYDIANAGENAQPLKNKSATFVVYYKPFPDASGDLSVTLPTSATAKTYAQIKALYDATGSGWTNVGSFSTGNSGVLTISNKEPGVYVFLESKAPDGYAPLYDENDKLVVYSAVVTGGLTFTNTDLKTAVTPYQAVIDANTTVQTNFVVTPVSGEEQPVVVKALDPKMATLKAHKTVDYNNHTYNELPRLNWSVTLDIYDAETGGTKVGTVTLASTSGGNPNAGVQFKLNNKVAYFNVGQSYWLQETVNTPAATNPSNPLTAYADGNHLIWVSYKFGDAAITTVTPNADGTYPRQQITPSTSDEVLIEITNRYMYGAVTFFKYNAEKTETLSGAEFEVRLDPLDERTKLEGAVVTEVSTGKYRVLIPLVSESATDYYIVETKPPQGYVLNPDPSQNYVKATLSWADSVKDYSLNPQEGQYQFLTDPQGNPLEITKFAGVYANNPEEVGQGGARFTLYHGTVAEGETEPSTWTVVEADKNRPTDTEGKVAFETLLTPFQWYAFAETGFDANLYRGIESMYMNGQKLTLETITVGSTEVENAYVFKNEGTVGTIEVYAYNYPLIKPTIAKIDVGKYPDGVHPIMNFDIYEVPANFTANRTNVEGLAAAAAAALEDPDTELPKRVYWGLTDSNNKFTDDDGYLGTYTLWNAGNGQENWDPSKTYILVETNLGAAESGKVYDTMVKDDPRVRWFWKIEPVENPDPKDPPTYTLKNINGLADVDLTKTVIEKSEEFKESDIVIEGTGSNAAAYVNSLITSSRKVAYTLEPEVTGKNQMLRSFVLEDAGLTAEPTGAPFTYAITEVHIGKAGQSAETLEKNGSINAKIKAAIYLDNDTEPYKTVDVTADDPTNPEGTVTVSLRTGTQTFRISYYSDQIMSATGYTPDTENENGETVVGVGYVLGEEFKVAPTEVLMKVNQIAESAQAIEITKFVNTATATLTYSKWASTGASPVIKTEDATADAEVKVHGLELPIMNITKVNNLGTSATPGTDDDPSYIKYTITVTNDASKSATAFNNPVVIDILPTGVQFVEDTDHPVKVLTGTELPLTAQDMTVIARAHVEGSKVNPTSEGDFRDNETALIFKLRGTLEPGYMMQIEFWATIDESTLLYEVPGKTTMIRNDAYLSSWDRVPRTVDNPHGYAFAVGVGDNGKYIFGDDLAETAVDPADPTPAIHESGVHDTADFSEYITDDYAWIRGMTEVAVVKSRDIYPQKGVRGDQDTGFHDSGLGWATRTVIYPGEQDYHKVDMGYVDWRLSAANGPNRDTHDLVIGDVIPKVGDGGNRGTNWDTIFGYIASATVSGTPTTDYTIWVIRSDKVTTAQAENRLRADMPHAREEGYLASHDWEPFTNVAEGVDDAASITAKQNITAFIMVFGNVTLEQNHSMVITFRTYVQKIPRTDDNDANFFNNIAFTNATNDYKILYREANGRILSSNPVSVSILDGLVQVEGDVWIDEDWDAEQDPNMSNPGHARRDYSQYTLVQQLIANGNITFAIKRNFGTIGTTGGSNSGGTNENPGYGESIQHFKFEDLTPGLQKPNTQLYQNGELNVKSLKGSDPANYWLEAYVRDTALLDIFKLTDLGSGHYMSDDPTELVATGSAKANALDSNFDEGETVGTYITKPFYLRYSTMNDQSKDIGFRMERDLEITKYAADDETVLVAGAKFEVYGPFNEGAAAATGTTCTFDLVDGKYVYNAAGSGAVTELVTGADGKIKISGLNWWKEYVIKETAPAPGYDEEMIVTATATGAGTEIGTIDGQNSLFVLKIPAKTKTTKLDEVKITNKRKVEVQLNVEKLLNSYSQKDFTFKFNLKLLADGLTDTLKTLNADVLDMDPIETLPLTVRSSQNADGKTRVYGSFAKVTLYGAGTYTFTITEQSGTNGDDDEVIYDTEPKSVSVVVTWHEKDATHPKAGLYVDSITYTKSDEHDSQTYELIENTYEATGEWTPEVTKTLNGRDMEEGETFTFQIIDMTGVAEGGQGTVVMTGTATAGANGEPVNVVWAPTTKLEYTLADLGVHTYVIHEVYTAADDTDAEGEIGHGIPDDGMSTVAADVTVTVTVAEGSKKDGQLVVTPSDTSAVSMVNEFEAEGEWTPTAFKTLTGRKMEEGETFNFEVKEGNTVVMTGTATADENGNPKDIVWTPTEITYDQDDVGTHTYTISEVIPQQGEQGFDPNMEYSSEVYTTTVTVALSNPLSDKLDVSESDHDEFEFINHYEHQPTSAQLPVSKKVTEQWPVKDPAETFTFTMTLTSNNLADVKLDEAGTTAFTTQTVTLQPTELDAAVTKNFAEVWFMNPGTFVFEIIETPGSDPSFQYDTAKYTWTVTVTKNPTTGKLEPEETLTKTKDGSTTECSKIEAEFINPYVPNPTAYTPQVKKIMTDDSRKLPVKVTVNFKMTADSNNPEGATIAENGTERSIELAKDTDAGFESDPVQFGAITFTAPGRFKFSFEETGYTPTTLGNFTNVTVPATSTIEITVAINGDGDLYVQNVTKTGEGELSTDGKFTFTALFTNKYIPDPTSYQPKAKKLMSEDSNPLPEDRDFQFKVTADSSNPAFASLAAGESETITVTVKKNKTESDPKPFTAIGFTAAGTYKFKFTEITPTIPGITRAEGYQDAVLTIIVEDDGTGSLVITEQNVSFTGDGELSTDGKFIFTALFTNKYTPTPTSYQPMAKKLM
ncbi:MAG: Cna B-type domain-containing protein, partial [Clostridia bacterium]|nr:Cna B-type domain-containing protein [Clostridia bacterium]